MARTRDFNPRFFENPSFYINLNAVLFTAAGDLGYPEPDPEAGMREMAPFEVYFSGRVVSALMGLLAIAFTYAIGRRLFGSTVGLLAALIGTMSIANVQHAHYATTNVTAGAMLCGAVWASVRVLYIQPSPRDYMLAGLLVGLAGSTKYNVGLVGVIYVLCGAVVLWRTWHENPARRHAATVGYMAGYVAVAAGFFIGTPYALLEPQMFWDDFQYITSEYLGGQGYPETNAALPLHGLYMMLFGVGPVAAVLTLQGIWLALRDRRIPTRIGSATLLVFLILYAVIVLRGRRLGDHLVMPIVNLVALFAAVGMLHVLRWGHRLAPQQKARTVYLTGLGLVIVVPLGYSIYFTHSLTQPDTREQAQAWIYAHIPAGTHIHLAGPYNVPLDAADYQTSQTFRHDYRPLKIISAAQGAIVLVVSDNTAFLYASADKWIPADFAEKQIAYEAALVEGLQEIARFERPRWWGDDTIVTTASYYHNPEIVIYCLVPDCLDE